MNITRRDLFKRLGVGIALAAAGGMVVAAKIQENQIEALDARMDSMTGVRSENGRTFVFSTTREYEIDPHFLRQYESGVHRTFQRRSTR